MTVAMEVTETGKKHLNHQKAELWNSWGQTVTQSFSSKCIGGWKLELERLTPLLGLNSGFSRFWLPATWMCILQKTRETNTDLLMETLNTHIVNFFNWNISFCGQPQVLRFHINNHQHLMEKKAKKQTFQKPKFYSRTRKKYPSQLFIP